MNRFTISGIILPRSLRSVYISLIFSLHTITISELNLDNGYKRSFAIQYAFIFSIEPFESLA
jgi:hypothetical protein